MSRRLALSVGFACLLGSGCAAKLPPPRYFRVEPIPEPARVPAVVTVPQAIPVPQLHAIPLPRKAPERRKPEPCLANPDPLEALGPERKLSAAEKKRLQENEENCAETTATIAKSRRAASRCHPTPDGFFNAIEACPYEPGALWHIYTAPLRVTTIFLQPGEQIMGNGGKPVVGDPRFRVTLGRVVTGGVEQQHVMVRPTQTEIDTSLTIITNRRTYNLEAHALPTDYQAQFSWYYPDDEIAAIEERVSQQEAKEREVPTTMNLSKVNCRYDIELVEGRPRWAPEQVCDDGRKTVVKLPKSVLSEAAPIFFVLGRDNEDLMVNYRRINEFYTIDRVFEAGELRLGEDIVRFRRKK
jgi:P-type conjugative transfer protein TrbG